MQDYHHFEVGAEVGLLGRPGKEVSHLLFPRYPLYRQVVSLVVCYLLPSYPRWRVRKAVFGGEPDYLREFGHDAVRVGQFAKYRPGFQLCNGYQVRVFFRCLSRANTPPRCAASGQMWAGRMAYRSFRRWGVWRISPSAVGADTFSRIDCLLSCCRFRL